MLVTIAVGRQTETVEVPSDLLSRSPGPLTDAAQDAVMLRVYAAFMDAYRREALTRADADAAADSDLTGNEE